jgi:hypothetical protein
LAEMSAVSAGEQERTEATEDARTRDPPPQSMSMLGSESSTGCARDVAEGAPSPLGSSEIPSANYASLPLGPRPPTCPPLAQRRSKARRIRAPRTSRREVASTAFGCRRTTLKATRLVFVPWMFFVVPAIVTSPLCHSPVNIVFLPSATKPPRAISRQNKKQH